MPSLLNATYEVVSKTIGILPDHDITITLMPNPSMDEDYSYDGKPHIINPTDDSLRLYATGMNEIVTQYMTDVADMTETLEVLKTRAIQEISSMTSESLSSMHNMRVVFDSYFNDMLINMLIFMCIFLMCIRWAVPSPVLVRMRPVEPHVEGTIVESEDKTVRA